MNLDTYNKMDDKTKKVVDEIGHEYASVYAAMLNDDVEKVRKLWAGDLGVTVTPFPTDGLDKIVNSSKVQAVRNEWINRARQLDVPVREITSALQP